MTIHYVNADKFLRLAKGEQDALLQGFNGERIIPIPFKLLRYVEKMQDGIYLLSGGRGGAKSRSTAIKLINECRNSHYFKCFYGRKEWTTNRETTHKALINAIKYLKIENEFTYSESPQGTLEIYHNNTGNYFTAFGLDKAEKVKGIEDPSHIWIDEADQISHADFSEILPTLRHSNDGAKCFILTFNRYSVDLKHWIVRTFYPDLYKGEKEEGDSYIDISEEYNIYDYFVNYKDNPFLPENYKSTLWLASNGSLARFNGLANGDWKTEEDYALWYRAFQENMHVREDIERLEGVADHITLDWNVVPYMSMSLWQIKENDKYIDFYCYDELALEHPNNTTEDIVNTFLDKYKKTDRSTVYFYGDAMGNRRVEGQGSYTRFSEVKKLLRGYIGNGSDRSIRYNPANLKRRDLMNNIFAGNFKYNNKIVRIFISSKCTKLIEDYKTIAEGVSGKVVKKGQYGQEKNVELNGHLADTADYLFASIFKDFFIM